MLCCQLILVPAAASLAEGICLPQIPSVVCQIPIKIQYFWKKFQYFFRRKPVQTSCGHCPNFSTGISGCPWPFWPDTRRRSKEDTGGGGNKKQEHPTEGGPSSLLWGPEPPYQGLLHCSPPNPAPRRLPQGMAHAGCCAGRMSFSPRGPGDVAGVGRGMHGAQRGSPAPLPSGAKACTYGRPTLSGAGRGCAATVP